MEFCSVCIKLRRGAKIWRHFAQNTYCRLREQIQQHYNVGGNLLKFYHDLELMSIVFLKAET